MNEADPLRVIKLHLGPLKVIVGRPKVNVRVSFGLRLITGVDGPALKLVDVGGHEHLTLARFWV